MHVTKSTIFTVVINLAYLEVIHFRVSPLFKLRTKHNYNAKSYQTTHLPVPDHVLGEWWKRALGEELGLRSLGALALELPVQPLDDK
jgi:hypothetical protein